MNVPEMVRKSGLVPPANAAFLLAKATEEEKPARPSFAEVVAAAKAAAVAEAAPEVVPETVVTTGPGETITYGDLSKEIEAMVLLSVASNPEKFAGPQGPQGQAGQSVSVEELRPLVEEVVEETIARNIDRLRGPQGESGPEGPQGPVGSAGESVAGPVGPVGPKGDAGRTFVVERPVPGERGPQGIEGPRGPAGLSEADVEKIVVNILTDSRAVSEQLMKVIAVSMELDAISTDSKYHRLGIVRDEICKRLREKLL